MEGSSVLSETIARIRHMEQCFDALQTAAETDPAAIFDIPELHSLLRELTQYYDGGQWLRDYEADEAGILPSDLKRGVLSQDAVYHFLTRFDRPNR